MKYETEVVGSLSLDKGETVVAVLPTGDKFIFVTSKGRICRAIPIYDRAPQPHSQAWYEKMAQGQGWQGY